MKKQVNLFLLLIIVVSIAMIAGMSVFYQERLSVLGNDYLESSDGLAMCNATLESALTELAVTKEQLEFNQEDVSKTVSLFEEKAQEVQDKDDEISGLEGQVDDLSEIIEERDQLIIDLRGQINSRDTMINQLRAEIKELEDDLDVCEEDLQEAC